MAKLFRKIFGEPIYTVDFENEVRKARLKKCSDGTIIVSKIHGWCIAESDGIIKNSYLVRWWRR